jgi:hypothetical protein
MQVHQAFPQDESSKWKYRLEEGEDSEDTDNVMSKKKGKNDFNLRKLKKKASLKQRKECYEKGKRTRKCSRN